MALLEISRLTRSFGGPPVLDGLDLTLHDGETACLVGPNGCGKSTLLNLIARSLTPDAGQIRFAGRDTRGCTPDRLARRGLGRVFQVSRLFDGLSVRDHLRLCVPQPGARRVRELLARFALDAVADVPAAALAPAQRRWLELALAIAPAPRLLLLDEPVAGLDRAGIGRMREHLRALAVHDRIACLIVEHDPAFVASLGVRVLALVDGRLVADGAYDAVRATPHVRDGWLGARAARPMRIEPTVRTDAGSHTEAA